MTHKVTAHLRPSRESAAVIADFYPPLSVQKVYHAEKEMRFILNGLIAKGAKRTVLLAGMKLTGLGKLGDLFIPYEQVPGCVDSDEILYRHYEEALALAEILFRELETVLRGEGDFGPGFDHTFGET